MSPTLTANLLEALTALMEADGSAADALEKLLARVAAVLHAERVGVTWPVGPAPLVDVQCSPEGELPAAGRSVFVPQPDPHRPGVFQWLRDADGTPILTAILRPAGRPPGFFWLTGPLASGELDGAARPLRLLAAALAQAPVLATRIERAAPSGDPDGLRQRWNDAARVCGRVAHDFDNLLTGILGFGELTLTALAPGTPPHQYMTEVISVAQQGVQFTQQLHRLSRSGRSRGRPGDPAEALRCEADRVRTALAGRQALRVELPAAFPTVPAEPESLRLAVGMLLDNAREALPAGAGEVELTAAVRDLNTAEAAEFFGPVRPGPALVVTVTDTGPGLSADARRRLLAEPFFTTKARHRGLGLGVALRTVQMFDGGLALDNRPAGGARARLALPLAPTDLHRETHP